MSLWTLLIIGGTLFVAYANGANDSFKGVATLFGSGAVDYKKALWWATATTFAGSVAAFFLASKLVSAFQGKGLVPFALARSEPFILAAILGAALTVFLASKVGIPISTTHSLTGALLGSGAAGVGLNLDFTVLVESFLAPLLLCPLVAVGLATGVYPLFKLAVARLGMEKEGCICVEEGWVPARVCPTGAAMGTATKSLRLVVDRTTHCAQQYSGTMFGVSAQTVLDMGHYLSAGAVSFARGLNDTPKIVALGLASPSLDLAWGVSLVALIMALGGILEARKVAEMVSHKITGMDHGEGFTANLITSFLVIVASKCGLPVSTTHVSIGTLFGIGIVNGQAKWGVIRNILLAWILTLPVAAVLAAGIFLLASLLT